VTYMSLLTTSAAEIFPALRAGPVVP